MDYSHYLPLIAAIPIAASIIDIWKPLREIACKRFALHRMNERPIGDWYGASVKLGEECLLAQLANANDVHVYIEQELARPCFD